ncbi:hypothetical protein D3C80_1709050 [compost metagenome]
MWSRPALHHLLQVSISGNARGPRILKPDLCRSGLGGRLGKQAAHGGRCRSVQALPHDLENPGLDPIGGQTRLREHHGKGNLLSLNARDFTGQGHAIDI